MYKNKNKNENDEKEILTAIAPTFSIPARFSRQSSPESSESSLLTYAILARGSTLRLSGRLVS